MTAPFLGERGGLLGQPSAISQLLQGLLAPPQPQPGPGGPPPDGAAGAPQMPMAPPAAQPQPGMLDRIKGHLSGLLHMGDADVPAGYADSGLLTPGELKSAQPGLKGLLGAITTLRPMPGDQYKQNLNQIIQMHQLAAGVGEHQRVMAARANMANLFTPQPNETEDQTRQRLAQMYSYAMAHGDEETMKDVGATLRGIMTAPKLQPNQVVAPGGSVVGPNGKMLYQSSPLDKPDDYTQYIDKDGNTHPLKKNVTPPAGWKPLSLDKTQITVNAAGDRTAAARDDKAVTQYTKDVKPLTDRAQMLDQALVTLGSAASDPNPANRKVLYKSAMANFVQAADQKAQLRVQMLQYFNQIDPSISGRWDSLKDQLLKGERPAYQLQGMISHIQNLKGLVRGEVEQRRNGLIARRPELADALPKTDEFFTPDDAPATGGTAGGYSPNNPFAKKKP